jgi:preprotein translocase subunit SecE
MITKFKEFLGNVKSEMKRVTWPTKDQLIGSTIIVVIVWIMLSIYVFTSDRILQYIVKQFLL